jgi:hypothetical protein
MTTPPRTAGQCIQRAASNPSSLPRLTRHPSNRPARNRHSSPRTTPAATSAATSSDVSQAAVPGDWRRVRRSQFGQEPEQRRGRHARRQVLVADASGRLCLLQPTISRSADDNSVKRSSAYLRPQPSRAVARRRLTRASAYLTAPHPLPPSPLQQDLLRGQLRDAPRTGGASAGGEASGALQGAPAWPAGAAAPPRQRQPRQASTLPARSRSLAHSLPPRCPSPCRT